MQNILPQQAGLTVGSVIYRYTAVKNIEDDMLVHVQNEDALGDGYIFRETDDWSGLEGNNIYKVVPVGAIPLGKMGRRLGRSRRNRHCTRSFCNLYLSV